MRDTITRDWATRTLRQALRAELAEVEQRLKHKPSSRRLRVDAQACRSLLARLDGDNAQQEPANA
jgi:hypothetical protein